MTAPLTEMATPLSASALTSGRVLPVVEPLAPLLPEGGLVRGRAVSCRGSAAMSLAVSLAVGPTAAGSWLAVVGVPAFGLEAAEELGIPLERVVRVDPGVWAVPRSHGSSSPAVGEQWAELTAAVLDGFEMVIARIPQRLNAGFARKVQARLKAREAVLIALGNPGPFAVDVDLHGSDPRWDGVEAGAGYLRGRQVEVTSSGRRVPRSRRASLWLPGPGGTIAAVDPVTTDGREHDRTVMLAPTGST